MKKETELRTLTDLLVNQEINYDAICMAMFLICRTFSFLSGAVYETDDVKSFYKKESYEAGRSHLPDLAPFLISEIPSKRNQSMYSVLKKTYKPSTEIDLLDIFQVENLIVVPLANNETQGFLIFTGEADSIELHAEEERLLFLMTAMISRYIITRINENKVRLMQKTYESILDSTGIDIYVNDFYTHDILYVNQSMAEPYGGKTAFEGRKCWEVLFPGQIGPCEFCPQKHIVDEKGRPSSVYTWDYQRAFDGSWFRVFSSAFYWIDGRLAHVVSSADITDNKQKEEIIQYMANYDELTRLPNHRKLLKDGEQILKQADKADRIYILFFDVDGFKAINDTFGHDTGDEFLVALGTFFKGIPLLRDCIYRYGGDEFAAVIHGRNITRMNIENLSRFIHNRFHKPWILEKGDVNCNVSIGAACYGEDADTIKELLYIADMAMYEAKKKGNGNICYGMDTAKDG